jgi:hypothetical protein
MKIRTTDGTVEFARGSVSYSTTKTSFLSSPLASGAQVVVENDPYVTFKFVPESGIGATVVFMGEKLQNLAWAFHLPNESEASWSEESEMLRKKLHEEWLEGELGEPPYRFGWGEIASEYDAKGISSAIIVAYGT